MRILQDIYRSSSSIAAYFYTDQGSNRTPDVMMVAAGMTQSIYISPVNWIIVNPLFAGFLFTPPTLTGTRAGPQSLSH